jgi:ACS family hexuronate transporter-like MFS transporter
VTGGTYAAVSGAPTDTWKYPFRIIGSLGVVWVVLWVTLVPRAMLRRDVGGSTETGSGRFWDVFYDRRFWALFAMVVGINIAWHGYRTWLPKFLMQDRGYSEADMSKFTTLYYLVADVGSWTVGGLTLVLIHRGRSHHGARMIAYTLCALLTLLSLTVPHLSGAVLQLALLTIAFGALGLFPTYFAFSQELSVKHQGKVTGTLGAGAHFSLAAFKLVEGYVARETGSRSIVLAGVGVAPLIALAIMFWLWPRDGKSPAEPMRDPMQSGV